MKNRRIMVLSLLAVLLLAAPLLQAYSSGPRVSWVTDVTSGSREFPQEVALGSDGSVYVVGYTYGSFPGNSNHGGMDAFVARVTSDGVLDRVYEFGSQGNDVAGSVLLGGDGSIFVSGAVGGDLNGVANHGKFDGFIVRLDRDFHVQWTLVLGSGESDFIYDISQAGGGYIYAVGSTLGSINGAVHNGDYDVFAAKVDGGSGKVVWVKNYGTGDEDQAFQSAVDREGNLYIVGYTAGSFKGNANQGGEDVFAVKIDPSGKLLWARQFGSPGDDEGEAVTISPDGRYIYVAGSTTDKMTNNIVGEQSWTDFFVAKLSTNNGGIVWVKQFGSTGPVHQYDDEAYYITALPSGDILVSGEAGGSLEAGSSNPSKTSTPFLLKLDADGNVLSVQQYGIYPGYAVTSIAEDSKGNTILALGYTPQGYGAIHLVKLSAIDTQTLTSTTSSQLASTSSIQSESQMTSSMLGKVNLQDPRVIIFILAALVIIAAAAKI